jgi:TRAP-type C4-dicarboxylate transport system substrate-binding protein
MRSTLDRALVRALRAVLLAVLPVVVAVGSPCAARAEAVIRIGTVAPEGSRFTKDLRAMTAEIERLSGHQVAFKWYTGARLGGEKAMADTLMAPDGKLDAVAFSGIGLPYLVPEMKIWIYPGLLQNVEEVDYMESRYKDDFVKFFDRAGLVMLTWTEPGFNYVHSATRFDSFDELKKQRMWLWLDDEHTTLAIKAMGFEIDVTTLGELQDWLREHKVGIWLYPPLAVIAFGLQKYSRFMIDMPITFLCGAFVVRKDVFERLPADVQRAIRAVGDKWSVRLTRSWRAESERSIEAMRRQGTTLVHWSDTEKQKFFYAAAAQRGKVARAWGLEPLMRRFAADLDVLRQARQK